MRTVLVIALLLLAIPGMTQDEEWTRKSLAGLNGMALTVSVSGNEGLKDIPNAWSKERIQAEVEKAARDSGIRVLADSESEATPGRPTLYVSTSQWDGGGTQGRTCYSSVRLSFCQSASLVRDPKIQCWVVTWAYSPAGVFFDPKDYHDTFTRQIADAMTVFINAYMSVNPESSKRKGAL